MVNENPPIEEQKDKEQNWDSIRKSLSFFSDEEFEQWKSFNEEQEKGNITPEEHQKNLEELQKKSVERRNKEQEEQNKKDKTTKEELDKAKTQSEKEKQEKLNKKKEELNNPDTPKETNQPIPVKISDTTKTPKEITSEKTPSKS
jgi:hypothetical protein